MTKFGIPQEDLNLDLGRGLFAQALVDAMPELPIADEDELGDSSAREQFRARILTYRQAVSEQAVLAAPSPLG